MVKLYTSYVAYRHRRQQQQTSAISVIFQASSPSATTSADLGVDQKTIVSLGSGVFLAVALFAGLMTSYGSREARLFYLLPTQLTFLTVVFPVYIISSNRAMRQNFFQKCQNFGQKFRPENRIVPAQVAESPIIDQLKVRNLKLVDLSV